MAPTAAAAAAHAAAAATTAHAKASFKTTTAPLAAASAAAPGFSIAGPFHSGRGKHGLDLDLPIEKHAPRLHPLDGGPTAAVIGSHGARRRAVGVFALAGGEAKEKQRQRQPA
jgi:hypothetical protein